MIIDKVRGFNTDKDKLIWTKIISIFPTATDNTKTTHIVKYYQNESEEYYIFEYIDALNNGNVVTQFQGYNWKEVMRQIDFSDSCFIYSQDTFDKNYFGLLTIGRSIKIKVEKYIYEQEIKNKKEFKISSR